MKLGNLKRYASEDDDVSSGTSGVISDLASFEKSEIKNCLLTANEMATEPIGSEGDETRTPPPEQN